MKRIVKPLTAAQRTISIFTGKTDAEDECARDGSLAAHKYDELRMQPRAKWKREGDRWITEKPFNGSIEVVTSSTRPEVRTYRVFVSGSFVGTFNHICDAANAAEGVPDRKAGAA